VCDHRPTTKSQLRTSGTSSHPYLYIISLFLSTAAAPAFHSAKSFLTIYTVVLFLPLQESLERTQSIETERHIHPRISQKPAVPIAFFSERTAGGSLFSVSHSAIYLRYLINPYLYNMISNSAEQLPVRTAKKKKKKKKKKNPQKKKKKKKKPFSTNKLK